MAGVSRHNSGLTNDDSTGFVEQEETSSLDSIEWTDEKHSLYLKSMEASFVNQLYNSKDLFSWCPLRQGSPAGSSQFEVHQHGYWQNKFYGIPPQPEEVEGRSTFLANPWIEHFRGARSKVVPDNDASEDQPLGYKGQILTSSGSGNISRLFSDGGHHQVSLDFNEEFSDQNFVNEDCENEAATEQSGRRAKRLRTLDASAAISNDEVKPDNHCVWFHSVYSTCRCKTAMRAALVRRVERE